MSWSETNGTNRRDNEQHVPHFNTIHRIIGSVPVCVLVLVLVRVQDRQFSYCRPLLFCSYYSLNVCNLKLSQYRTDPDINRPITLAIARTRRGPALDLLWSRSAWCPYSEQQQQQQKPTGGRLCLGAACPAPVSTGPRSYCSSCRLLDCIISSLLNGTRSSTADHRSLAWCAADLLQCSDEVPQFRLTP